MELSKEQLKVKATWLEDENRRLRSQLLDTQIIAGAIRLEDTDSDAQDEGE
ncbi:hypothetical protein [Kocuria sp. TGY1127_2]|uniref:hypothetical protein n=1 Tax=Kocuria sp. TGY1127_2 TaxID=2711328 RepID=UPI0015BA7C14|nr:hypothetical protein [Kocuria sp. TGY1127_2]